MSQSFPSATNTYIPAFDTTGNLIVEFSRNVKSFKVNQYTTLIPVQNEVGYYLRLDTNQVMRNLGYKGDSFSWPDGADRPQGTYNNRPFEFFDFRTIRHSAPAQLGYLSVKQAAWDIKNSHSKMLAQQLMTLRTNLVNTLMTDSTNYDSTHVATATALGGGLWSAGSIANPYIQRGLMAAANTITKDTAGSVEYSDLSLVINPTTAVAMSTSAEIRDYLAQSPFALAQVRGDKPGQNSAWGLPDKLYGINIIVEQTVVNTSQVANATQTNSFTMPDNYAVLLARKGSDLVGVDKTVNFSSVAIFAFQEMNTETFDDVINQRHLISVTDNYDQKIVAPASTFLITNVTS